ncbi:Com family DNA-binding transcriptional regulator [Pseudomonas aeruginosa]|uniref:Com family DNA-binding transcriptional regulator n=1 Tax=Pseudomonas aeruginosa TaxID=287 RepID=UPI000F524773|nr:Com family DNA-binding transcriptional regulator [Pseudomonas aeruginosa]RQB66271.1 Com family DNA-binding transcriptional regulator [Pseudomonas aeruginosa]
MLKEIRCGKCNKLMARAGNYTEIQIKCPRCGSLNHMKTESLFPGPRSPNDSQETHHV